eukprot:PhM_4_TR241/c0_g1_i1/m.104828/K12188/SNF8, EAP30; ESCRT-II complex subunit VPS22
MKRGVGVAYIKRNQDTDKSMKDAGRRLDEENAQKVADSVKMLRERLTQYVREHGTEIHRSPALRMKFKEMCDRLGVDLLTSQKSVIGSVLGLGSFYYEVAVLAIEHCVLTRSQNGGVVPLDDLARRISRAGRVVSESDVVYSLSKLECLGPGYVVRLLGSRRYILPGTDLTSDTTTALEAAAASSSSTFGCPSLTVADLGIRTGWSAERRERALEALLRDGVVWLERRCESNSPSSSSSSVVHVYWFPCLMSDDAPV